MHYIVTSPVQPVSGQAALGYIGVALLGIGLVLGLVVIQGLRDRFRLIARCRKRLIDAKRQATFGCWESAAAKMRIVARESPVPLENLGLDEEVVTWAKAVARRYRRDVGGSFYV